MCIYKLKHNGVFIPSILSDSLNSQSDGMLTMFSQFDRIFKMKIVWCILNTKPVLYTAYSMMNCYAFYWEFDLNIICDLICNKGPLQSKRL